MEAIEFFSLRRPVQERFVDCVRGAASPAPLLVAPARRDRRVIALCALSAVLLVVTLATLHVGYGQLDNPLAIVPARYALLYAGLFALVLLPLAFAARLYVIANALPYAPRVYLFPIGVVDARSALLAAHRVTDTTRIEFVRERSRLNLDVDGARFTFPVSDPALGESIAERLVALRERIETEGVASTSPERALLDPLADNGFKNPFAPPEPMRPRIPLWVRVWVPIALLPAALFGAGAFKLRNAWSETELYAVARGRDRSDAYRAYLARGGQNRDVVEILLPRAELRDAQAKGGVDAIEAFEKAHPNSKIQVESRAALQAALIKELAEADAHGTLSALKEFAARRANHDFIKPAVERAIELRIRATLATLRPELHNDPHVYASFDKLLHYSATHGPELELLFRRRPSDHLEVLETQLRKSGYYSGPKSLPAQYFDPAHEKPREDKIAQQIAAAFAKRLPADTLRVVPAEAALENTEPPAPLKPRLLVDYKTTMSGAFGNRKPRLVLTGIGFICKVSLELPGDPAPLNFKFSSWRAPDMRTMTDETDPADVYEEMVSDQLTRFVQKYLTSLFAQP